MLQETQGLCTEMRTESGYNAQQTPLSLCIHPRVASHLLRQDIPLLPAGSDEYWRAYAYTREYLLHQWLDDENVVRMFPHGLQSIKRLVVPITRDNHHVRFQGQYILPAAQLAK